ncbi:MAG TPA: preprotein translocase subunit SecE [Longimicrobiaceae bacterium]|nr:preprotein translocase subunit SecE [Longimicrobiaceae bacterium]
MADTLRTARDFIGDVQTEMEKVTWPDWEQLKNSTFVVLVFVVVIAALIFVIDFLVSAGLRILTGLLGG